jgi:hypothetical protein
MSEASPLQLDDFVKANWSAVQWPALNSTAVDNLAKTQNRPFPSSKWKMAVLHPNVDTKTL